MNVYAKKKKENSAKLMCEPDISLTSYYVKWEYKFCVLEWDIAATRGKGLAGEEELLYHSYLKSTSTAVITHELKLMGCRCLVDHSLCSSSGHFFKELY